MLPNRVVSWGLVVFGLVAALAPVVANLDWTSTAGIIAGVGVVAAAGVTWLRGWQSYEERDAILAAGDEQEEDFSAPEGELPSVSGKAGE